MKVATAPIRMVHPPLPPPVKLRTPAWRRCENEDGQTLACLTLPEAAKTLRNKEAIGRWMSAMSAVVRYYRGLDAPSGPSSIPAEGKMP